MHEEISTKSTVCVVKETKVQQNRWNQSRPISNHSTNTSVLGFDVNLTGRVQIHPPPIVDLALLSAQRHLLSSTDKNWCEEAKGHPQFINARLVICDVPETTGAEFIFTTPPWKPREPSFLPVPGEHKVLQDQLEHLQDSQRDAEHASRF